MRLAICNEIFESMPVEAQFALVADAGYHGVEIAPFTLGRPVTALAADERSRIRRSAAEHGLVITGLHWLLARVPGMHIAAADPAQRGRTVEHLVELSRLCHDLGGDVLVFGSPAARSTPDGMEPGRARDLAVDSLRSWAERSASFDVTICLESLPTAETDFMTTIADARGIAEEIGRPNVRLVLDVKSMSAEDVPVPTLIESASDAVAYVQANDANRGGPGFGDTDFVPIFRALRHVGYDGVVSVEAFDVEPGAEHVARASNAYLRRCAAAAGVPIPA